MKRSLWMLLLSLLILLGTTAMPVQADGIIIPPPCPIEGCPPPPCRFEPCPPFLPRPISQLIIRYHRVDVTIDRQIAVTRVDQVFFNPNDYPIEGTYLFPLPTDASVSNFMLWVDGEPVEGKVLPADEARRTYQEIVLNLRDPALLEYFGRGALQASIFPIPPQGERRIQLEYTQALTAENGLVRYVYPLNTEKFSLMPLEDVSVRVAIKSDDSIRAIYSPTHPIDVTREGLNDAMVGWEDENVLPDTDFAVYYSLGNQEAFHLLTYRDPASDEEDGFFMLLLAPRPDADQRAIGKDVILVLDRSGSMEGEKFTQAQAALRYVLSRLNPEDRFHLLAFSTGVETYARGMRSADEAPEALAWVDRLSAAGSTDINRALLEAVAVADEERPTYLIFLTDGLPTVGELESQKILDNVARSAPESVRLFSFGVGYDVDTVLLDTLSSEHHGLSTYVRPEEPLDEVLSSFYERISTPVMTDLSIDFGEVSVFDLYPQPLPDLFAGTQTVVVGRYREGGVTDILLEGMVNGEQQRLTFRDLEFARDSRGEAGELSAIPRLWATRKIGYLLNQIRLKGPDEETIDQIVRLSVRYGIITPYTSYLVTEPMPLGSERQDEIASDVFANEKAAPMAPSGESAFERAAQEGALQSADLASGSGGSEQAAIRVVGQRTFIFRDGTWFDTSYDPDSMQPRIVPFLSAEYFELAQSRADVAAGLALGERVVIVVDGRAIQVGEPGEVIKVEEVTPTPGDPSLPAATPQSNESSSPDATRPGIQVCGAVVFPLGFLLAWVMMKKRGLV